MKQYIIIAATLFCSVTAFTQTEKYFKAMEPKVTAIDTVHTAVESKALAAAFERIAEAEKTQWLPFYYAALAQVNAGYFSMESMTAGGAAATVDPIAKKAEELLNKAEALSPNNSEIYIVRKMIASLRMVADPMSRYMQYAPLAQQALNKAAQLNPNNPRIYLLQGQDKFYTPEQFGGSKTEAKQLLQKAVVLFEKEQPASAIDPHWGKTTATYFLTQMP